ncbi:putative reverse transcriptase domain-containing protein [Tanacetum coccineum]
MASKPRFNREPVMSSASSVVTYTSVYTDSEPGRVFWGADEEISDGGVPRVIVLGYDGLPMQPVDPPSPDYVPGPEHPASPDYVPGPEHPPSPIEIPFVPEPEYPEYLVPSEDEAPMEDQPLPADASPVALSPGYVPDSDPEEDPEEDSEEEHADYPADGGDGDDEPSGDDTDDDDADDDDEEPFEDEEDDEEEEEHLAPADSSAIPIVDPVPSAGDTEAFETDESAPTPRAPQIRIPFAQTRLRRARKSVRPEPPMSASMEARIAEHAAAPTPPLPVVSSPLPLPSPLTTSPTDTGAPLGYRAAGIRMRAADASPPLSLPPTSPRTDIPEAEMPPRKRACLTTPAPGYEIGESSAAGAARQPGPTPAVDTWDEIVEAMMEIAPTTLEGVDQRVTELDTTVRQRTEEFEIRFEEAHDDRAYLGALNVMQAGAEMAITPSGFRNRRKKEHVHTQTECTYTNFLEVAILKISKASEGVGWPDPMAKKMESCFFPLSQTVLLPVRGLRFAHIRYCPRGEIKKLESKYWNLKVRGTDLMTYNQRFQELALMCINVPQESLKGKKAIEFATEMMDKKMLTAAERQAENKRKFEDTSRNNQNQQQPFKRNNVARAYTAGPGDKKPYGGTKPLCHYKSDCPKLKNGNQGNRAGNGNAVARAYVVGSAGTNPNSNVVTGTFLLNNRYASILFDTGADRSFISTAFSSLIDIIPTTLDHGYDVELADGRIIWVNTLIRGCTLNFLNHPFNIDLMPVEMGSFDVIIGMDCNPLLPYDPRIIKEVQEVNP